MHDLTDAFEMTVVHAGRDAPVVIELRGELDLNAAKILAGRVEDLLAGGVPALHVSCAGLSFVDSSGLHALIHACRQAEEHDAGFVVVSMSDRLRALVDLTATAKLLQAV